MGRFRGLRSSNSSTYKDPATLEEKTFFGDSPNQHYDKDYEYQSLSEDITEDELEVEEWNNVKPPATRFIIEGTAH
jgi:hypothetical protein